MNENHVRQSHQVRSKAWKTKISWLDDVKRGNFRWQFDIDNFNNKKWSTEESQNKNGQ